uniref:NACHT and WD repeat domain containing 2 n=1 Tax=Anas platyrhynchos platyrhynchos TaxID=8840 RepID=A0A493TS03_ANAPP
MWAAGAGGRLPCPRDAALRRAAFAGNLAALPAHLVPSGRSVRVFISANPEDTIAERNALREHVYPKLREFCRENYGLEFQVIDLYWGVEEDEWDSPELQKTRMKLLEDCLKSSAGPCFVMKEVARSSALLFECTLQAVTCGCSHPAVQHHAVSA